MNLCGKCCPAVIGWEVSKLTGGRRKLREEKKDSEYKLYPENEQNIIKIFNHFSNKKVFQTN